MWIAGQIRRACVAVQTWRVSRRWSSQIANRNNSRAVSTEDYAYVRVKHVEQPNATSDDEPGSFLLPWVEWDTGIPDVYVKRAGLLFSCFLLNSDMYLDGGVLIDLTHKRNFHLATLMWLSIIAPQVGTWFFLRSRGMSDFAALGRILFCPCLGAILLLCGWLAPIGWNWPFAVQDFAVFLFVVTMEPICQLSESWKGGQECTEGLWFSIAEGLMEAPASSTMTLYLAMQTSTLEDCGPSLLFKANVVSGIFSITRCSTKLYFYGESPSMAKFAKVAILDQLPKAVSRIIAFALVAILSMPVKPSTEDSWQTSGFLAFWFLAQEFALNVALLRTLSPKIGVEVSLIFGCTMLVSGPPGFLSVLNCARPGHATQHFVCILLMAGVCLCVSNHVQWFLIRKHYSDLLLVFAVTVPWAFLAPFFRSESATLLERAEVAPKKLREALLSGDKVMASLLVEVEGAKLPTAMRKPVDTNRLRGFEKWNGICAHGGLLYCCPF